MNKQRGYISSPEGIFVALFTAGVLAGALLCVALVFGLPWVWDLLTR